MTIVQYSIGTGERWQLLGWGTEVFGSKLFQPRTDHDLDHLDCVDPNLLLRDAVRKLCSAADPTQVGCPRSCRLYGSHPAT